MSVLSVRYQGETAIVTLDNPPVNAVSEEVRKGLVALADKLDEDNGVAAVVLTCAGRTFIAGADVREFGKPPVEPHLPDVVTRLEQAKKPWVAAIHGAALGGGFEIAMADHWRRNHKITSVTLAEDFAINEAVQTGLESGANSDLTFGRYEGALHRFNEVVEAQLR